MTASHISSADLATLNGKVCTEEALSRRRIRSSPNYHMLGFLPDFGFMVAQLAFIPLALFTMTDEGQNGIEISILLWVATLTSGFFTLAAKHVEGTLSRFGTICLALVFCVAAPFIMGFTALMLVSFALGGPAVLVFFWKPILFLGFFWFWFNDA